MKNKILAITFGLITLCSQAKNLNEYRASFYEDSKDQLSLKALDTISTIRDIIDTQHLTSLDSILSSDLFKRRDYIGFKKSAQTSGFFKNKMDEAVIKLLREDRYGTPMSFNPEWSVLKFKEEKLKRNAKQIIASINTGKSEGSNENQKSQIFRFIEAFKNNIVDKKNNSDIKMIVGHKSITSMKHQLANYIKENSPINAQGETINDILGRITSIEVNEGIVNELNFLNSNKEKTSTQLSMMLSYVSEEDDYYVQVQDILVKYLIEQTKVFEARTKFLEESNVVGFLKNIWKSYIVKISSSENTQVIEKTAYEQKHLLDRQVNHERTIYFLEGVDFKNSDSKTFLQKRIDLNKSVISYLEKTLKTSKEINGKLKKLSSEQANFLLDLHLRLRGDDFLTDTEILGENGDYSSLTRLIGDQIFELETKIKTANKGILPSLTRSIKELKTDFYFYKIMADQIYRLEKSIKTNKKIYEFSQSRIEAL